MDSSGARQVANLISQGAPWWLCGLCGAPKMRLAAWKQKLALSYNQGSQGQILALIRAVLTCPARQLPLSKKKGAT